MISILRAVEADYSSIAAIGRESVYDAHQNSCSAEVMNEFIKEKYSDEAIKKDLTNSNNIYHIIKYNDRPSGFSKLTFNTKHPNIVKENVAKLDRIYLLKEFHGFKLGFKLLQFNIELSQLNNQEGMWLYTWIGNKRAIDFYMKAGFGIIGNHDFHVAKTHYNPNYQMFLDFSKDPDTK